MLADPASLGAPAETGGEDLHLVAVLRDGAARQDDALVAQLLHDLPVRERAARFTVDSCIPMRSPTSARVSGRRCWMPLSRNSRWHSTIVSVIRLIVRRRWLMLSMKNFARVTYSRMC